MSQYTVTIDTTKNETPCLANVSSVQAVKICQSSYEIRSLKFARDKIEMHVKAKPHEDWPTMGPMGGLCSVRVVEWSFQQLLFALRFCAKDDHSIAALDALWGGCDTLFACVPISSGSDMYREYSVLSRVSG